MFKKSTKTVSRCYRDNFDSDWRKVPKLVTDVKVTPKCDTRLSCREPVQDENGHMDGSGWTKMTFNILHLVVLLQKNNILKMFLEKKDSVTTDEWLEPVKIAGNYKKREKTWILNANLLHVAAKFNPDGLFLILSTLKEDRNNIATPKRPSMRHASSTSFMDDVIFKSYGTGMISPLHVAATNPDSLSTK